MQQPLGTIPLQYIYQLIPSRMEQTGEDAISFHASIWFKKKQELEEREFVFGCRSAQEMDEWLITLDFLKTKAAVDSYREKNIDFEFGTQQGRQSQRKEVSSK